MICHDAARGLDLDLVLVLVLDRGRLVVWQIVNTLQTRVIIEVVRYAVLSAEISEWGLPVVAVVAPAVATIAAVVVTLAVAMMTTLLLGRIP